MDKQVIVFSRKGCQTCERLLFELEQVKKIKVLKFDNVNNEPVFYDFINNFKINRFPAVQLDDGKIITTLHKDPNFDINKINEALKTEDFKFQSVPNIEAKIALIEEFLKD